VNEKIKGVLSYFIVIVLCLIIGSGSTLIIIYTTPIVGLSKIIAESKRNDELNKLLEKRISDQRITIDELGTAIEQYKKHIGEFENSITNSSKSIQQIEDSIRRDRTIFDRLDKLNNENKNRLTKLNSKN
jgi:hypothetical protein